MSDKDSFLTWKINKGLFGWDHKYADLIDQAYDKGVYSGIEELTRLQSEVERLRGRCGELEDQLDRPRIALLKERTELRGRLTECHQSINAYVRENERLQGLIDEADKATPALILRKQAEAVEAEAREWNPDEQTYSGRKPHKEMIAYAQRLRQQSDEAEKAGR